MPFDQYHEPFEELPEETRTFARLIMSTIEEADAINWYEQRMAVETDEEARQVMSHAQKEEFIHFGMDLEFLLRRNPTWRTLSKNILFKRETWLNWPNIQKKQSRRNKTINGWCI
ncbi:MAG TPA: hypothetical protein VJ785_14465 [Anaerolineales bacterium]|nr:hypothetical protein [Anaerolineales bacterium]